LNEYAMAVGVRINPDPKRISGSSGSYFTDNKDTEPIPMRASGNEHRTKEVFIGNIAG